MPAEASTDRAAAYARVLDELLPTAQHVTVPYANNRVEADHGRIASMPLMSATTGMRRSEMCGLRWADLNLVERRLSVSDTRVVVRGKAQDSDGKTVRSRRLPALDPATVADLVQQQQRQAEEKAFFGAHYPDGGQVFAWENGRQVHPDVIRQRFRPWLR